MSKTSSRALTRGLAAISVGVLGLAGCSSDNETKSYQGNAAEKSSTVEHDAPSSEADKPASNRTSGGGAAQPVENACSEKKIAADMDWPDSRISKCDEPWAIASWFSQKEADQYGGIIPGDSSSVLKLEGGTWMRWSSIPSTEKCQDDARDEGAPAFVVESVFPCSNSQASGSSGSRSGAMTVTTPGGRTVTASRPSCDGRGVLIVQSVIDVGGNVQSELAAALDAYPDAEFSESGACASLRPSVNGQQVYAVWIDYGQNISGLCSAAAGTDLNARILKNEADYSSPC